VCLITNFNFKWHNHSLANIENHSLMISQLVDMEWKFGVTASSNEIDKFGNVFLQLKLVLNKGDNLETCFMGINFVFVLFNLIKIFYFRINITTVLCVFT
jgi:hypothetical protein